MPAIWLGFLQPVIAAEAPARTGANAPARSEAKSRTKPKPKPPGHAKPRAASAAKAKSATSNAVAAASSAPARETTFEADPAAERFVEDVSTRRALPPEWLRQQLAQARRLVAVRKLVMPPPAGVAKNWAAYRSRFVEPQRVQAGVAFWRDNESWLAEAEQRYGVPPEIVVSIVGVETFYGRVTGNFRLLDALATLAFDFPPGRRDRSDFFRGELEELFVLCAREGIDPPALKGSYAGAMGLPQFMPSSVNRHAVDFDGDGRIDLLRSTADVIGSVASYLATFGWQRGMATHHAVAVPVDTADRAVLLGPDILPTFTAAQFSERGAELDTAGRSHNGLLALVELQNGDSAPSYVAGTANFYAITRYNWSSYYAMAVIDLAQAVRRERSGP